MSTEQLIHFMCFTSWLSVFAKMAELFFANIKYSILEANQKREVSCLFRCYDDDGLQILSDIDRKYI